MQRYLIRGSGVESWRMLENLQKFDVVIVAAAGSTILIEAGEETIGQIRQLPYIVEHELH